MEPACGFLERIQSQPARGSRSAQIRGNILDTALIGGLIGAALVGTFVGIFLSYAVVGPVAAKLKAVRDQKLRVFFVVKQSPSSAFPIPPSAQLALLPRRSSLL